MTQKYYTEDELRSDLKAHLLKEANNLSISLKRKKLKTSFLERA